MAKASPILTTFDAGLLSPVIGGRVDLAKYFNGLSACENALPLVQGPVVRRGGTRFVAETMNSAGRTWLVRFQVSETISYMLEFGGGYIRFYTDRGQLVSGGAPVQVSTPYSWADLTDVDGTCRLRVTQSADTMYVFHESHQPYKLLRLTATSFTFSKLYFKNGPFKDVNSDPSITVTTNGTTGTVNLTASADIFTSDNVDNLFYLESYDRSAVKPWGVYQEVKVGDRRRVDYRVYECTAVGTGTGPVTGNLTPTHTSGRAWDGDGKDLADDQRGPIGVEWQYLHSGYGIVRISSVSDAKHATGVVTQRLPADVVAGGDSTTVVTQRDIQSASAENDGGGIPTGRVIVSLPIGHGFNVNDPIVISGTVLTKLGSPDQNINGSYVVMSSTASAIYITASWPTDYAYSPSANGKATRTVTTLHDEYTPTYKWAHALFSSIEGWPEHGAFWRERLVLARGRNIAMSVVGDFQNFSAKIDGEVTADAAIVQTLNARQINRIVWVVESDELILGTNGDEWVIGPIQSSEAVGPGNIRAARRTAYGSRSVQPVEVGGKVLFVQAGGRKLRDYRYDYGSDNYISTDVTKLNPEISISGLIDMTYQQEAGSVIWAARADGTLVGCTYDQEAGRSDVYAWHPHPMTNGFVESVETMPSPDGAADDLWLIVRRTINGQTKRYVEYLTAPLSDDESQSDSFYVDSGLTYRGAPTSTVSGLAHLEGQEVDILVDGATHPRKTVVGGQVTLQAPAKTVHVGLPYRFLICPMRIEAGSQGGTAQGKIKRLTHVIFRFYRTSLGGKAGPGLNDLETILSRSPEDLMDEALPLFSGDTDPIAWRGGYETDGYIWYVNEDPLPVSVLAIMPIVSTNDDR